MNLTLDTLLEDLEKQAGITKQAADDSEKDEKQKDKSDKDDKSNPFAKKDDKEDKDSKNEKEKKDDDEQTKEASAKGADLAKEVMQKVASIKLDQVKLEDNMTKQAADAGKAIAQALLEKLANVGDQNTVDGIASATPNKTQVDLAAQVAEQAAQVQAQPGTDGAGNGGTINQIFDAIVADALGKGAAPLEQHAAQGVAGKEGNANSQAPNQVQTGSFVYTGQEKAASDEHEKAAAVSALVNEGHSFEDAVSMVKAAAEEIAREEDTMFKQAAFNHLIENGIDFDTAVAYVKKLQG